MGSVRGRWEGFAERVPSGGVNGQWKVSVTFHEHSMIQGCGTLPFVGNRRVVGREGLGDTTGTEIRHIDAVGVLKGDGIPPDHLKASWTLTSFS